MGSLTLFAISFLLAQAQHIESSSDDTSQLGRIQRAARTSMQAAYSHRAITEENLHKAAYHLLIDTLCTCQARLSMVFWRVTCSCLDYILWFLLLRARGEQDVPLIVECTFCSSMFKELLIAEFTALHSCLSCHETGSKDRLKRPALKNIHTGHAPEASRLGIKTQNLHKSN